MLKSKLILLLFLITAFSPALLAQSKKQLRQDNEVLKSQVGDLQTFTKKLANDVRKLEADNETLLAENKTLTQVASILEDRLNSLEQDSITRARINEQLIEQINAIESQSQNVASPQVPGRDNFASGAQPAVSSTDTRPCSQKESMLMPGKSYHVTDYQVMNKSGWGVQVYAFSTLCQAESKAQAFMEYYKMYNTYIRVKSMPSGSKVYSVIYGSLKDRSQAEIYLENFKKIARNPQEGNAFLVQH